MAPLFLKFRLMLANRMLETWQIRHLVTRLYGSGSSLRQTPLRRMRYVIYAVSPTFIILYPSFSSLTVNAIQIQITIWLNGGPGCSSLDGLFQENGPFLWQAGTYGPIRNPYSWTNLTNMVYVDQPAGTGYSPGPVTVNNEYDVAAQFKDFWKRFMDTFDLHGRKVYITGESYAGMYVPYIASGMLDEKDTTYFNVTGIQINDPSINEDYTLTYAPVAGAVNYYNSFLALNESFVKGLNEVSEKCGFTEFMEKALTFPPVGKLPQGDVSDECDAYDAAITAAYDINPCFNLYHAQDFW